MGAATTKNRITPYPTHGKGQTKIKATPQKSVFGTVPKSRMPNLHKPTQTYGH